MKYSRRDFLQTVDITAGSMAVSPYCQVPTGNSLFEMSVRRM